MNGLIDNVQTYAREAREFSKSPEARDAERGLRATHQALPSLVDRSAGFLEQVGIKAGESRTTSRRLADASVSELVRIGGGRVDNVTHTEMTKHILRNVLVQEAAGHELAGRINRDAVRDFSRDEPSPHGEMAMKALEKSKVDVTRVFGTLEDADLRMAASGSYDRLSPQGRGLISEALGRDNADALTHKQIEYNRTLSPVEPEVRQHSALPIMVPARRLHRAAPAPVRQPTFGRRVAAHAMAAAGQSM